MLINNMHNKWPFREAIARLTFGIFAHTKGISFAKSVVLGQKECISLYRDQTYWEQSSVSFEMLSFKLYSDFKSLSINI